MGVYVDSFDVVMLNITNLLWSLDFDNIHLSRKLRIMATDSHNNKSCTAGEPLSTTNEVLTTGAGLVQSFAPVKNICAHLNAFHVYASDPSRAVESTHYCAHVNE